MSDRTIGICRVCENPGNDVNPRSSLVKFNVNAKGFFDTFRLKSNLRSLLREENFTRWFPLNRHTNNGITLTYDTYLPESRLDSFMLQLVIKVKSPTEESDKLINRIHDTLRTVNIN